MKYSTKSVNSTPEILKRKLGAELFVPVTIHSTAFTSGVCKAGTPIDKDGKVANTADVKGILLNDVYDENPNGSLIVAYAVVNKENAKANSGVTLSTAVIEKLSNITFE